jgi:polysaccharide pyruvyl transferase WcaK-like protein
MGFFESLNMDALLEGVAAGTIQAARFPNPLQKMGLIQEFSRYKPGDPLRVLLVGYNGARNTGADVRVEAMVRQFYHVFGQDNIKMGLITLDREHSSLYYKPPTELIQFSTMFLGDLLKASSSHHLSVLCEGSCFKSKFANALTTFFIVAAGIMRSQKKACIAYGSEAGYMDWLLRHFVKKYAKDAYIISRTNQSAKVIEGLGLKGDVGTDTAWGFVPAPASRAEELLRKNGWDGQKPILGLAVINPFCWPVHPSLGKLIKMKLTGRGKENYYDKFCFFSSSAERTRLFNRYIDAVAKSADAFVEKHNVFPIIIGMERLDLGPNKVLQSRMKGTPPIFCSEDYNGYEMTAVLHKLSMLITSRYHARVLSMPGGVASGGISMDERLENLLTESRHVNDYYLKTDDPDLAHKLPPMMERLWQNREQVSQEVLKMIPGYLEKMASMAEMFKNYIRRVYPEFPLKDKPAQWTRNLPPLEGHLKAIMEKYG